MGTELQKYEIINEIARRQGHLTYLEVCTPLTGFAFEKVDANLFEERERLVYRCSMDEDDGMPYTYRTSADTSLDTLNAIWTAKGCSPAYNLIFVDPWHTLEGSLQDLQGSWRLLKPGGHLVVHDCNPPDAEYASPQHRWGGWCGETYRAYIEFLTFRSDIDFYTVDADYGCGVIRKLRPEEHSQHSEELLLLWLHWAASPDDPDDRYNFFCTHRRQLLKLRSPSEFLLTKNTRAANPHSGSIGGSKIGLE